MAKTIGEIDAHEMNAWGLPSPALWRFTGYCTETQASLYVRR